MCDSPLIGIKLGIDSDTGKYRIKLKKRFDFSYSDYCSRYGKENVVLIPCGRCPSCILARRKEWSIRCQCEAEYHPFNCFVTLTYDDMHLPSSMDVVKKDLKKFIKSIRNSGYKVRYFGCGERGERSKRLHAHIILFGFKPTDLYYDGTSTSGEALYTSKFIDAIWAKGRAVVQDFDGTVGSYVAGYTSKKLGDQTGFQIQSTRPGIGYQFAIAHADKHFKYDSMFGSFGVSKIPRYFEKVYSDNGFQFYFDILKDERSRKAQSLSYQEARNHGFDKLDYQINYSRSFNLTKLSNLVRLL